MPRVERGEFINVGLAMMCKRCRWLRVEFEVSGRRLALFDCGTLSSDVIEHQLRSFAEIASGNPDAGPIARYPVEERFRWITAAKSACIRASAVHPGLTYDLEKTFRRLYDELVAIPICQTDTN